MELPTPPGGDPGAAAAWVAAHLPDLCGREVVPSPAFRGGQGAADAALAAFDVAGYAARRNEVWPQARRGASRLSPYVRHGLIALRELWDAVAGGPARDVGRFRDELLWQEYARHLYARVGGAIGRPLRAAPATGAEATGGEAWDRGMACIDLVLGELERDGWLVNQARMWLASQWAVRHGRDWREGERRFRSLLLDGSAAANGLGWQWVAGTATGRPYGFSRRQVEKRAPGLCDGCAHRGRCPIEAWPRPDAPRPIGRHVDGHVATFREHPALRRDPDPEATGGPASVVREGAPPDAVWLTAESLGDRDPALAANPGLPAVFCIDERVMRALGPSGGRLVFLAETLGDLASRRPLRVMRGDPVVALAGWRLAVTHAPVPGFRRRAARLAIAERHPWPWLTRPHAGSAASFSSWIRRARAGVEP